MKDDSSSRAAGLRALAGEPERQAEYAAELVERGRNPQTVMAALAVLRGRKDASYRDVLLRRYRYCDENGSRRDPGGTIRAEILKTLRPVARPEDVPLLEHAVSTYEYLYGYGEATRDLRAAGLLVLNEVDGALAGFYSIKLLDDDLMNERTVYVDEMTGEPATTAVRVLASQERYLPLYAYLLHKWEDEGKLFSDVLAECLRSMTSLPERLLAPLVERYGKIEDEIVLLGLFDLLFEHEAGTDYTDFVMRFLQDTRLHNIYRYVASSLVAGRDPGMIERLETIRRQERDQVKSRILREALDLR